MREGGSMRVGAYLGDPGILRIPPGNGQNSEKMGSPRLKLRPQISRSINLGTTPRKLVAKKNPRRFCTRSETSPALLRIFASKYIT